jgi:hypothetical protein
MTARSSGLSMATGLLVAAVGAFDCRLAILRSQSQATSLGYATSLELQDGHPVPGGR